MGLNAKNKAFNGGNNDKNKQAPVEPGTYPARVVQVIDFGVQEQPAFKGEAKPPVQEIMVTYELTDEFVKDEDGNELEDKPRWISERFPLHNLKSDLAKSTKRYYAIDPKGAADGDWTKLIGWPVMVTIVNNPGKGDNADKIYEKIASTSTAREKEARNFPNLKNEGKIFNLEDASTLDILLTLPNWIQEKIKTGLEFEGTPVHKALLKHEGKAPSKPEKPKKEEKKEEPVEEDEGGDEEW